jgi:replication factor A1|tara:strand:- start:1439 stop:1840 length:402 start_codon:yes stop_codon:yes gene_type:complete
MVEKTTPEIVSVDSLRPGTTGLNVVVKVLDAKEVMNKKRPDGSSVRIVECTVGDASGVILFSAKNKQQVETMKVGKMVRVQNGKIDMIRGTMRLTVDQWGLLKEETEGDSVEPDGDNNLSLVEYELVASTDGH